MAPSEIRALPVLVLGVLRALVLGVLPALVLGVLPAPVLAAASPAAPGRLVRTRLVGEAILRAHGAPDGPAIRRAASGRALSMEEALAAIPELGRIGVAPGVGTQALGAVAAPQVLALEGLTGAGNALPLVALIGTGTRAVPGPTRGAKGELVELHAVATVRSVVRPTVRSVVIPVGEAMRRVGFRGRGRSRIASLGATVPSLPAERTESRGGQRQEGRGANGAMAVEPVRTAGDRSGGGATKALQIDAGRW